MLQPHQAPGQSTYNYDAEGRRTLITNADGSAQVQMYAHTGQLMYAENILGVVAATVTYSCPGGGTLSGTNCVSRRRHAHLQLPLGLDPVRH